MTRRRAIWLLPVVLVLHNLEEGLFFPEYVPRVLERLPAGVRDWIGPVSLREMGVALALATVIPLGFSLWAAARPANRTALWLVLAMWATLLLNVAWHVAAALVLFGGYAPGVATALALNLPLSVLVLRRAATEQWLSRRARWALMPAAVAFHLPGALGVMLVGRVLSARTPLLNALTHSALLLGSLIFGVNRLLAQQPGALRTYVIEGALTGPPTGYYDVPVTIPALRAGTYSHRLGLFRLFARGQPGCYDLLIRAGYYLRSRYRIQLGADTVVRLGPLPVRRIEAKLPEDDWHPPDPKTLPEDTVGTCRPALPSDLEVWPAARLRIDGIIRRGMVPIRRQEVWVNCGPFGGARARTDSLGRFVVDLTAPWPDVAAVPGSHAPCFAQLGGGGIYPVTRFSALSAPLDSTVPVTRPVISLPASSWRTGQRVLSSDSVLLPGTAAIQSYIGYSPRLFEILPRPQRFSLCGQTVLSREGWPRADTVPGPGRYRMTPERALSADSVQVLPMAIRITVGVQNPDFGSSLQLVVPDSVDELIRHGYTLRAYARLPKASSGLDYVYCHVGGDYAADTRIFTIRIPEDFADDMRRADHSHQLDLLLGVDRPQP